MADYCCQHIERMIKQVVGMAGGVWEGARRHLGVGESGLQSGKQMGRWVGEDRWARIGCFFYLFLSSI